jgi:hypothetical protein
MRYYPPNGTFIHPPPAASSVMEHLIAPNRGKGDDPIDWIDLFYVAVTFGTASGFVWILSL